MAKIHTCRGLLDLPRFYRQLAARQRRLAALRIGAGRRDFYPCGHHGVCRTRWRRLIPRVAKIFGLTLKKYLDASRPADFLRYRHTTSGWLQNHLLEPLAGVGRTLHLKPWRRPGGDGVRLERLASAAGSGVPRHPDPEQHGSRTAPGGRTATAARAVPEPARTHGSAAGGGRAKPGTAAGGLFRHAVFAGAQPVTGAIRATSQRLPRLPAPPLRGPLPNSSTGRIRRKKANGNGCGWRGLRTRTTRKSPSFISSSTPPVWRRSSRFPQRFRAWRSTTDWTLMRCGGVFRSRRSAAAYFETLMGTVPAEFDVRSLDAPPVAYADRIGLNRTRTFTDA